MSQNQQATCPQCGAKGQSVDNATVKSLIAVTLHRVQDVKHRFCATVDCPVVYFAEDHSETFCTQDLRERVYQKEPEANDVLVCYCFFHTLADIRDSVTADTRSPIVDDINAGIQAGECACDWRNPQGNCCLGNVIKIVKSQVDTQ